MNRAGVTAVESSLNGKTGIVSATYVAQATCPSSCPFMGAGCYAETGHAGIVTARMRKQAKGLTITEIAIAEAEAIDGLTGYRPLRLHIVGDCPTDESARIVSKAAGRYSRKHGQPVWTYTHAWRTVKRASWGTVFVRASCETLADVSEAKALGYAAAIVVDEHEGGRNAYATESGKVTPCPEQTMGATCERCRLCWTQSETIAFAAHGVQSKKIKKTLDKMAGEV